MKKKKDHIVHAVVAPAKKQVRIMQGKTTLKVFSFTMDVPSEMVEKEFSGYDWGTWTVSDRDYTYKKIVKVWDEKVMEDIRRKAMEYYNQQSKSKQL
jgi:hypothetical protein